MTRCTAVAVLPFPFLFAEKGNFVNGYLFLAALNYDVFSFFVVLFQG